MKTAIVLVVAAASTASAALLAGIGLLVFDPASGSNTEAVFGFTAAVSGLLTAALAIAVVIYAQSRNLWRFTPTWIRLAVLVAVIVGVVRSIVISLG